MSPTSPLCVEILHKIEADFTTVGSDITNLYRDCIKQTGPEKYKCMDTSGILAFMNNVHVREDIHADDKTVEQWDLCNLDLMQSFKRDPLGSYHVYNELLRKERDLRIVRIIINIVDCFRNFECLCAYCGNQKMGWEFETGPEQTNLPSVGRLAIR